MGYESLIEHAQFSSVYKLDASRVIKRVPKHLPKPHSAMIEYQMLSSTRHTNIIELLEKQDLGDDVGLVLPFYQQSLAQLLKASSKVNPYLLTAAPRNTLDPATGAQILRGIAAGLEYIHALGIIHRDIKPGNIMLDGLTPKIIDFGTAFRYSVIPEPHTPQYTADDEYEPFDTESDREKFTDVSTTIYKAPELLFGVFTYTTAIDIWSLGMLMVELFSRCGGPAIEYDGDLRLIGSIFALFGQPSAVEWPEAAMKPAFIGMFGADGDGKAPNADELIPRASDEIKSAFMGMMVYESCQRLTAGELVRRI